jgi:hypothetical protein
MKSDWLRKYRRALDEHVMANLPPPRRMTSTSSNAAPGSMLTFGHLKAAMDRIADLPPPPIFGMSVHLSKDNALIFSVGKQQYVGGHPDLWKRIASEVEPGSQMPGIFSTAIVDLDLPINHGQRAVFLEVERKDDDK